MKMKLAVIGAGNGGFAMAGDLTLAGYGVNLFELPEFEHNIIPIRDLGGIEITGHARTGFAKLSRITTDIGEAVEDCSSIMIVTQSPAQEKLARLLAPIIREDQFIFLLPGSAGSILMSKIFSEEGVGPQVGIAETVTLPYACRKSGETSVHVLRRTGNLGVGSFPGIDIDRIFPIFKEIYSDCHRMDNALEVGICNTNFIAHPAPFLLSLSRIEFCSEGFPFYHEAFTPSVERVVDVLDQEIASIFRRMEFSAISSKAACEKRFGMTWDKIQDIRRQWGIKISFESEKRFITEDVQVGLVMISSMGRQIGVPTPVCDALIVLAEIVEGKNLRSTGRTMKQLGLGDMNIAELKHFLKEGF